MIERKNTFKSYGIFDKITKERVMYIKATKRVDDFKDNTCTFYFGNTLIGKVSLKHHFVVELL